MDDSLSASDVTSSPKFKSNPPTPSSKHSALHPPSNSLPSRSASPSRSIVSVISLGSRGDGGEDKDGGTGITKEVALKVIAKKKVKGNESSVWSEMEVLRGLDHPNIVSFK